MRPAIPDVISALSHFMEHATNAAAPSGTAGLPWLAPLPPEQLSQSSHADAASVAGLLPFSVSSMGLFGPLQLYPHGHSLHQSATLLSILTAAMPDSHDKQTLQTRAYAAANHVTSPAVVRLMSKYGMTPLEAECKFCYTAQFASSEESIYYKCGLLWCVLNILKFTSHSTHSYNSSLRSRSPEAVDRWRDFSFVFKSALDKLPACKGTLYRCVSKNCNRGGI